MPYVRPILYRRRAPLAAVAGLVIAVATAPVAPAADFTTTGDVGEVTHTLVVPALSSARTTELDRTQVALSNTELQSSGFYLPASTALSVFVHKDSLLPTLVVGAPDADARKEFKAPRQYPLQAGRNTVTDAGGGVVYLKLIGSAGEAKVSLGEEVQPMPYFVLGKTSEAEFQAQLDERTTPYVELVGPHTMITVERASALKFRAEDHGAVLATYEEIVRIEDEVSGYDGSAALHARQAHPYHFVGYPAAITGVGAYATHGHMSFPPPIQDRMLTVEGLQTRGWGVGLELDPSLVRSGAFGRQWGTRRPCAPSTTASTSPRSSRPTTSSRPVSTWPCGSAGCRCRTTCPWSGTTTCRSPPSSSPR